MCVILIYVGEHYPSIILITYMKLILYITVYRLPFPTFLNKTKNWKLIGIFFNHNILFAWHHQNLLVLGNKKLFRKTYFIPIFVIKVKQIYAACKTSIKQKVHRKHIKFSLWWRTIIFHQRFNNVDLYFKGSNIQSENNINSVAK